MPLRFWHMISDYGLNYWLVSSGISMSVYQTSWLFSLRAVTELLLFTLHRSYNVWVNHSHEMRRKNKSMGTTLISNVDNKSSQCVGRFVHYVPVAGSRGIRWGITAQLLPLLRWSVSSCTCNRTYQTIPRRWGPFADIHQLQGKHSNNSAPFILTTASRSKHPRYTTACLSYVQRVVWDSWIAIWHCTGTAQSIWWFDYSLSHRIS